ncbi:glycosyltransferase family 2 protein [Candidatus Pelagibacter sp.]|uniref:glycosyltransferase family 2 protein n=1 Tax=Candidatus Pelagibacter sp. TaxID=2024849 RepID=UPI003F84B220
MISIIIPTYNNLDYLKLCLKSLKKNSSFNHEIIIHINDGSDGTLDFIKTNNYKHTSSVDNIGLCSSINKAAKLVSNKYILYSHDDMYFCPNWDKVLLNEVNSLNHDDFYLSGTMIEPNSGHIIYDFGIDLATFNENKLLSKYKDINFYDHQGTHFAPHLVSKKMWDKVGGFSEEFNPGIGSDPDFNMKLWKQGVRIFKGLNDFKVYHFGSLTTRKKKNLIQNRGDRTFLKKWGFSTKFFKKYYLKSKTKYEGPLNEPKKTINYLLELLICKIRLFFT